MSVWRLSVVPVELGVNYLLKGSVQRSGGRIRINVYLADAGERGNLWAERYDKRLDDIFDIQDEITARIVSALRLELSPADQTRMTRTRMEDVRTYDEFLRGLDYFGRRSLHDTLLAKVHFERATELDPSVPQIYFVEGLIDLFRRNFDAAIQNTQQAISIKPSYGDAFARGELLHGACRTSALRRHSGRRGDCADYRYRAHHRILCRSRTLSEEVTPDDAMPGKPGIAGG